MCLNGHYLMRGKFTRDSLRDLIDFDYDNSDQSEDHNLKNEYDRKTTNILIRDERSRCRREVMRSKVAKENTKVDDLSGSTFSIADIARTVAIQSDIAEILVFLAKNPNRKILIKLKRILTSENTNFQALRVSNQMLSLVRRLMIEVKELMENIRNNLENERFSVNENDAFLIEIIVEILEILTKDDLNHRYFEVGNLRYISNLFKEIRVKMSNKNTIESFLRKIINCFQNRA
ncbi:hypothetical protein TRFO_42411 [Tritrichomonas foetus]|uniref:Uncharacterized protein n=1 Tax=Tritrichomonas foetus TaxID=1144522 RepID=A0A1J4L196_9EUKA|nr:hypothetical protein TRFO_42411 [Tritrichomonas foetus]|eukprot:OHT15653.1 hypothetical protein TRFO_42411 [Tritrichomonas foetus]